MTCGFTLPLSARFQSKSLLFLVITYNYFIFLVAPPNLDHYVFLRVSRDEPGYIVEPETDEHGADRVDFETGAQHLMRYQPIEDLVESGSVSLI